jgi:hypothetical protein
MTIPDSPAVSAAPMLQTAVRATTGPKADRVTDGGRPPSLIEVTGVTGVGPVTTG